MDGACRRARGRSARATRFPRATSASVKAIERSSGKRNKIAARAERCTPPTARTRRSTCGRGSRTTKAAHEKRQREKRKKEKILRRSEIPTPAEGIRARRAPRRARGTGLGDALEGIPPRAREEIRRVLIRRRSPRRRLGCRLEALLRRRPPRSRLHGRRHRRDALPAACLAGPRAHSRRHDVVVAALRRKSAGPSATRAVAAANGANCNLNVDPLPPRHRLGREPHRIRRRPPRKRWLLVHEGGSAGLNGPRVG